MQINIDTNKINKWVTTHLNYALPIGLLTSSWFTAQLATQTDHGMMVWYGTISVISGIASVISGVRAFLILLDIK